MTPNPNISLATNLRNASVLFSDLCLYQSAKWCIEALDGLQLDPQNPESLVQARMDFYTQLGTETDKYLLGKMYFDTKEYDRCAFHLKDCKGSIPNFLRLYAQYMAGEKRREEEGQGVLASTDGVTTNNQLVSIIQECTKLLSRFPHDPYLLYLYGVVMSKQNNYKEAIEVLVRSLGIQPYNWSCWMEILTCMSHIDGLDSIVKRLPKHLVTTKMFIVVCHQVFCQPLDLVETLIDELETIFPQFHYLTIQKALLNYHNLGYAEAEQIFDHVINLDPHRLDDMDAYSNILYVMEKRSKLSFLAQLASCTDKFRPETCCIIANYYSLRTDHEKAITYYRRALTLNRNCLSAWTLMGHEFVELKNSHAAIESYRRAVDTNQNDYRAWYGLGQAYEVLDMHYYSLYYYQRATALKPMDPRMWQALSNCFEKLKRYDEAIKGYKRSLAVQDNDPTVFYRIAALYEKTGDQRMASKYMEACLGTELAEGVTDETAKARIWLARYEFDQGNFSSALRYAMEYTHGSPQDLEEARAIVKTIQEREAA